MKFGKLIGIFILCVLGYYFFFSGKSTQAKGFQYVDGWKMATKMAQAEHRPILLNFGGPW